MKLVDAVDALHKTELEYVSKERQVWENYTKHTKEYATRLQTCSEVLIQMKRNVALAGTIKVSVFVCVCGGDVADFVSWTHNVTQGSVMLVFKANIFQRDYVKILELTDHLEKLINSFPLTGELVHKTFQFQDELMSLAGCESKHKCETTKFIEDCAEFQNVAGSFLGSSLNDSLSVKDTKSPNERCFNTFNSLKLSLDHFENKLFIYDTHTAKLNNILTGHLKFIQESESNNRNQDCLHVTTEALGIAENVQLVMSKMSDMAQSQHLNELLEMSKSLVFLFSQRLCSQNSHNWGNHWTQVCSWSLNFSNDIKYLLLVGRENFKSCYDNFFNAETETRRLQRILNALERQIPTILHAAENARKYLSHRTSRWSLKRSFSDPEFQTEIEIVRSFVDKIENGKMDFYEEVVTGFNCIHLSFLQFFKNPILAFSWEVFKELETTKEIEATDRSVVVTENNTADALNILFEGRWLWTTMRMLTFNFLVSCMKELVEDVHAINLIFELYTDQTEMDSTYFM